MPERVPCDLRISGSPDVALTRYRINLHTRTPSRTTKINTELHRSKLHRVSQDTIRLTCIITLMGIEVKGHVARAKLISMSS